MSEQPYTPYTGIPEIAPNRRANDASVDSEAVSRNLPKIVSHEDFPKKGSNSTQPTQPACVKAINLRKGIDDLRAEAGRMHKSGHRLTQLAWSRVDELKIHQSGCATCGGAA